MSQTFNSLRLHFTYNGHQTNPIINPERIHIETAVWWYRVGIRPGRRIVLSGMVKDGTPTLDGLQLGVLHEDENGEWHRNEEITDFSYEVID